ncbi:phosphatidylserine/phosphatidylglycerophosphate/cardiolipin synthase family protein [Spirillospora sp. NPDC050679]
MARRTPTRAAALAAAATCLGTGLAAGPAAGLAAPAAAAPPPKPVINGPVFNDPLGPAAAQRAIFDQTIRLIDATPAGQEIRASVFGLKDAEVAGALKAAAARGVRVKVIVDDDSLGSPAWKLLSQALGTRDTAPSWIVACKKAQGCVSRQVPRSGLPSYNHNKFFAFSKVGPFADGTSHAKVVLQTSSNYSDWYKKVTYNDAVTFSDARVYDGYARYHEDQRRLRGGKGNNSYYRSTPAGGQYRAYFFPRWDKNVGNPATDTMVNALDEVKCSYTGRDGKRRQTDIRIVNFQFGKGRMQLARKLTALRKQGCWIDVVHSGVGTEMAKEVRAALKNGKVQLTACSIAKGAVKGIRPHIKTLLIDGSTGGRTEPRVYTGSHNYTPSALRTADEALVRIVDPAPGRPGAAYHAAFRQNFFKIRKACGRP